MTRPILLALVSGPAQRASLAAALPRCCLVFSTDAEDAVLRLDEVGPDLVLGWATPESAAWLLEAAIRHPLTRERPRVFIGQGPQASADVLLPSAVSAEQLRATLAPLLVFGRPSDDDLADEPPPSTDAQTVVGMPSPFFEEGPAPEAPTPVGRLPGIAEVQASLIEIDPPTPVGQRPDPPARIVEPTRTAARTGATPVPPPRTVEPRGASTPSRGVPSVGPRDLSRRRALEESQLGQRLVQRIRALHEALEHADPYQLLGVDQAADQARIDAAWFDLALELHPDRFFLLRSGDLKEKIYAVFRRIADAHQLLSDPEARAEYDRTRGSAEVPPPERPKGPEDPDAKTFAARAEEALAHGDLGVARFCLTAALACDPNHAGAREGLTAVETKLRPSR